MKKSVALPKLPRTKDSMRMLWFMNEIGFTNAEIGKAIGKSKRQVHYIVGNTYDYRHDFLTDKDRRVIRKFCRG